MSSSKPATRKSHIVVSFGAKNTELFNTPALTDIEQSLRLSTYGPMHRQCSFHVWVPGPRRSASCQRICVLTWVPKFLEPEAASPTRISRCLDSGIAECCVTSALNNSNTKRNLSNGLRAQPKRIGSVGRMPESCTASLSRGLSGQNGHNKIEAI